MIARSSTVASLSSQMFLLIATEDVDFGLSNVVAEIIDLCISRPPEYFYVSKSRSVSTVATRFSYDTDAPLSDEPLI
jgi:hypothetical protein